ncbi:MAG: hypothetical protein WD696_10240 [Bryobacteraceae bacterium]
MKQLPVDKQSKAQVYCPICTHTVPADAEITGRKAKVLPGQKCARCSAALDAGFVVQILEAA